MTRPCVRCRRRKCRWQAQGTPVSETSLSSLSRVRLTALFWCGGVNRIARDRVGRQEGMEPFAVWLSRSSRSHLRGVLVRLSLSLPWSRARIFPDLRQTTRLVMCFSCPCMVYSENQHRRIALTTTGEPLPSSTRPVSLWCGIYALAPQLFGVGQIFLQCFSRSEIRARYGIRGNEIEDAVVCTFFSLFSSPSLSWSSTVFPRLDRAHPRLV